MIHDMRPAVMDAIRGSMNRRGALAAALLAATPFACLGVEHASATGKQRHGKRGAKSEGKTKKAKAGPAGPPGAQGPAGARGPAGPKAITSDLVMHQQTCPVPATNTGTWCFVTCGEGEIVVSGGFAASSEGVSVFESARDGTVGWVAGARNPSGSDGSVTVKVYCLPT